VNVDGYSCGCHGVGHDRECPWRPVEPRPVTASADMVSNLVYINQMSTSEVWVSSDEED